MRKEINTAQKVIESLSKDLGKTSDKIQKESQESTKMQTQTEELHNKILALKQKHEDDKDDFEDNLKKLQT
mgnify:CR=1 FL=1